MHFRKIMAGLPYHPKRFHAQGSARLERAVGVEGEKFDFESKTPSPFCRDLGHVVV